MTCIACGGPGEVALEGLKDVRYDVGGVFTVRRCPSCGLMWIEPVPGVEELARHYVGFFRHDGSGAGNVPRRFGGLRDTLRNAILRGSFGYRSVHAFPGSGALGWALGGWPGLRDKAAWGYGPMFPQAPRSAGAVFVDIGCGEAAFLSDLKRLGWNVLGVEPHGDGADAAEKRGVPVLRMRFEEAPFKGASVDVIQFDHVLEHLYDPFAALKKAYLVLKPEGRLQMRVPNVESLGYRVFGRDYYGLDTPRHLFMFSVASLKHLLRRAGFGRAVVSTSARVAGRIYDQSTVIRREGVTRWDRAPGQRGRRWFVGRESIEMAFGRPAGEEIVLFATKTP